MFGFTRMFKNSGFTDMVMLDINDVFFKLGF